MSNAGANVLQRAANRDEAEDRQFSLRLIRDLLHKPLWFAGIGCMVVSFFLQAAGLGFATLAAVEPLLVLELPLTLIASRLWLGARLGGRAWVSIVGMTAGTIGLIAFLGPTQGRTSGISWVVYLVASALTVSAVAACYLLGRSWSDAARRSAILGVGTGIAYGLAAAMVKGMTTHFSSGGITGVLEAWQLYAAIAVGAFAVWMHQNSVSAGRLVTAQPGVTLGDPYVSILWGAFVYAEAMRGGFWIVLAVLAGMVMSGSAVLLSRAAEASGDRAAQEEAPDGRADESASDDMARAPAPG